MSYDNDWDTLTTKNTDEQVKFFLRAFVMEFQGNFEAVLDIAEEWKGYFKTEEDRAEKGDLGEFDCHLFLEKRGETLTVRSLRENLKTEIQLSAHHNVAFVEYLLWKYQKTLAELFAPVVEGAVPAELLQQFNEAVEAYLAAKEAERQREVEIAKLKETANNNNNKVTLQSYQAAKKVNELEGMEFAQAFQRMKALKKKKEAEKALAEAKPIDPYEEEQKRLEQERLRKEAEEKKKREESKARLKARASLWQ
eukprot:TRINITY_DN117527_c0_g1_i1.p1 TRINITY_DN117527_c0_g1~~TRINITY_DN117527_c0_g1_i1.p1  ORF type:complete len:259 (-),score=96.82 TRINITY_DN117527_c0_g1_i1:145-900(-)